MFKPLYMLYKFLGILLLFFPMTAYADNLTLVSSANELKEGALYTICYRNSNGKYFNIGLQEHKLGVSTLMYESDGISTTDLSLLASKCSIFQLVKIDSHWLLRDTTLNTYVGENEGLQTASLMQSYHDADENCYVTFPSYNGRMDICINSKLVRYHENIHRYELRKKQSEKDYSQVCLLRVEKEPEALTLYDDQDLSPINETTNVTLQRRFFDKEFNTLILPVDVKNYKEVFGTDIQAWELSVVKGDSLTYTPLSGIQLKANHPYLLFGTFNNGPYHLGVSHIFYDGADPAIQPSDSISIHGVYHNTDVSNLANAFVLHKGKFFPCASQKHLIVSPYKWYVIKR